MKKITLPLILVLLLSSCSSAINPNKTISDIPSSSPIETISESSSDMTSSEDSVELTPNEVAINTLLDYFKEKQTEIFDKENWDNPTFDKLEFVFQNVTGDEKPELLIRTNWENIKGELTDCESLVVLTYFNNEVKVAGVVADFLMPQTKNRKNKLLYDGQNYISFHCQSKRYDYERLVEEAIDEKYIESDYLLETWINPYEIKDFNFDDFLIKKGNSMGITIFETPSRHAFFRYVASYVLKYEITHPDYFNYKEEILADNFIKECDEYKDAKTGLYQFYMADENIVEYVLGECDYPKVDYVEMSTVVLPKADFEIFYAKYFALFEEVENPIYRSGFYNKVAVDYDKILEEAIAFFE